MFKTSFKAHPIMIFSLIKPYLFVLVLPIIRAIVQYLKKGETNGLLLLEIIAFLIIAIMAVFRWLSINITVNEGYLTVKKGFLIKSCAVIEVSHLSSIALKENLIDFIFHTVTLTINTEAGRPKKNDFYIKMSLDDAKKFYLMVYGQEKMELVKFSALKIALLAATTSSATTGIIIGVPLIKRASDLIGTAISEILLNEISNVSNGFNDIFPPVINTITLILILAYVFSFAIIFFKNVNFRLKISKKAVEIWSGFLVRKKIIFKKSALNNICIEQMPLMRIFKAYSMRVSIGGYGDNKGEKAVIVPIGTQGKLKTTLKEHFVFCASRNVDIAPQKSKQNLNRFLYIPAMVAIITTVSGIAFAIFLPYLDRIILFFMLIALGIDLYYASVSYYNYRFGGIVFGDYISAKGSKGFIIRELYCNKNKVGVIKIIQTPADKKLKTCKLKITIRSEGADGVRIKNIDKKTLILQLNKTFNLNINE